MKNLNFDVTVRTTLKYSNIWNIWPHHPLEISISSQSLIFSGPCAFIHFRNLDLKSEGVIRGLHFYHSVKILVHRVYLYGIHSMYSKNSRKILKWNGMKRNQSELNGSKREWMHTNPEVHALCCCGSYNESKIQSHRIFGHYRIFVTRK